MYFNNAWAGVLDAPAAVVRVHGHSYIRLERLFKNYASYNDYIPQAGLDLENVTHVTVRDVGMIGVTGCRLAELSAQAHVTFNDVVCDGLTNIHAPGRSTGMVVQNVAPGGKRKGAGVLLTSSYFVIDARGLASMRIINTDGILVHRCVIWSVDSDTGLGVDVDGSSNYNIFKSSQIQGAIDAGMNNCWKKNTDTSTALGVPNTCP
jgi:hypothetical protein